MITYSHYGAVFDTARKYRYLLWRIWDTNKARVGFIMLNPSTTEEHPSTNDATIRRCTSFAESWGYGGFDVGNLYAFRSTDPNILLRTREAVGPENDDYLFKMHGRNDITVAAWGNHPAAKNRETKVKYMLLKTGVPLYCLGTTSDGSPKHPLYLPATTRPLKL